MTIMHCFHPCRCRVSHSYSLIRLYPLLGFSINILQYKYITIDSASWFIWAIIRPWQIINMTKSCWLPHTNLGTLFRQKKVRKGGCGLGWGTPLADKICQTGSPCFVGGQIIIWNKNKRNVGSVWLVLFFSTEENKDYLGDANRWYRLTQRPHCHKRTREYYLCQQMSTDRCTRRPYTKPEPDNLNLKIKARV